MTVYKSPEKEFNFLLNEVFDYASLAALPGFEDATPEMVESVLPEAAKFFEQVVAPTNQPGDQQGSKLIDGKVGNGFDGCKDSADRGCSYLLLFD